MNQRIGRPHLGRAVRRPALGLALLATGALAAGCGGETASGTGADEVVVGAAGPLSGPSAALSAVFDGMRAGFEQYNAGLDGDSQKVEFKVEDDQFNPAQTPAAVRKLVENENAAMLCGTTGSANNLAVKDYVVSRKVPTVPTSGSPTLFNDVTYEIISDYRPLGAAVTRYALDDLKIKKIGILTGADPTGEPVAEGAVDYLKSVGAEPVAAEEFDPAATNFASQVAKLKAAGAEFVVTNGAPALVAQLINAADQIGYSPKWGSTFASANVSLKELVKSDLDERIFFSTPFPLNDSPDAEAFRDAMAEYAPDADISDPLVMEGYVMAVGCAEAIAAADEAGEVTPESLLEAMRSLSIDNDYIKSLAWSADNHDGAQAGQIITLRDGKFAQASDFEPFPAS